MKGRFDSYVLVVLLSVIFSMLWACTANQQSAALSGVGVASGAKVADDLIQSGEVERAVLSVDLVPSDLDALISAMDSYSVSRSILKDVVRSPAAALSLQQTIQQEHARLVEAYVVAQTVIAANWDSYSAVNQAKLKRWQAQAERLEVQYQNFLAAVDSEIGADDRYQRVLEVLKIVRQLALLAV